MLSSPLARSSHFHIGSSVRWRVVPPVVRSLSIGPVSKNVLRDNRLDEYRQYYYYLSGNIVH